MNKMVVKRFRLGVPGAPWPLLVLTLALLLGSLTGAQAFYYEVGSRGLVTVRNVNDGVNKEVYFKVRNNGSFALQNVGVIVVGAWLHNGSDNTVAVGAWSNGAKKWSRDSSDWVQYVGANLLAMARSNTDCPLTCAPPAWPAHTPPLSPTGTASVSASDTLPILWIGDLAAGQEVSLHYSGFQVSKDDFILSGYAVASNAALADKQAPSLALSSVVPAITNLSQISIKANFSEAVTGFASSDITVTNGRVTSFGGSSAAYSFVVTPQAPGPVTVSIPTGAAWDAGGNLSTGPASLSRTYVQPVLNTRSGQHYGLLGEAVGAAAEGDTIQAGPFTYQEAITIDRSLSLLAQDGDSTHTIIEGGVRIVASDVTVDGFTLRGGADFGTGKTTLQMEGVFAATVSDNIFTGSHAPATCALSILADSQRVTVSSNTFQNWPTAIQATGSSQLSFLDNDFLGNDYGLASTSVSRTYLKGNLFADQAACGWSASASGAGVQAELNWFIGNGLAANEEPGATIDARNNWWGDPSGPSGNASDPASGRVAAGAGDPAGANVRFDPWVTAPDPQITVSAPAPYVRWTQQSVQRIQWSASGFEGNVKIFFSATGSGPWTQIAANVPNTGSYDWPVTNGQTASARVRVTSMNCNSIYGESGLFAISPNPPFTIQSPAQGTVWEKNSTPTIRWLSDSVAGNVKILVSADGSPWEQIAWDIPNSGSFNWTIRSGASTNTKIRIASMNNNAVYGESGAFTIHAFQGITLDTPAGGEVWPKGSTQAIRWISGLSENVKVHLSLDGGPWTQLAVDLPNTGLYNWTIKAGPSPNARIRVTSMATNLIYSESDPFSISPGSTITVTAPAAAQWAKGSTQTIAWTSSNVSENVKIHLSLDGGPWTQLAADVPNTGTYNWTIAAGPSANAKIRVSSMINNAVYSESAPFSLTPGNESITVLAPDASTVWTKGATQRIQWSSANLAGNVKVFYSLDGGAWTQIAWDIPNSGALDWMVKAGPANNVRIRVTSMNSNLSYGESPLFRIQ